MNKTYSVQKLILDPDLALPEELFFRGDYRHEEGSLIVEKSGELVLNTYFNSFSAEQWGKLTEIQKVGFLLTLRGTGRVQLWCAKDSGEEKLIDEVPFALEKETEILIGQQRALCDLGRMSWIRLLAENGAAALSGGRIITETVPRQRPKLACCFCTYRREKELLRNVRELTGDNYPPDSVLQEKLDIYIADNGHTLSPEEFDDPEHVFLLENPNYGGSAGFTRCLIEAGIKKKGQYSHLILMDDDAVIYRFVLARTAALLSFLKSEYRDHMIGGALLSLEQPWLQMENGAEFRNRETLRNGARVDLREFHSVFSNQKRDKVVNYNAWVFSCIPAGFVNENNLPLPFFIHGDDVEYGLRFQGKILLLNGICVWHPGPRTTRPAYAAYYGRRNFSIVEAIYPPHTTAKQYLKIEARKMLRLLTEYRYAYAWYCIRGCRDFLRGADWFLRHDPEEKNREIRAWKQYEKCHVEDAAVLLEKPLSGPKKKMKDRVFDLLLPAVVDRRAYNNDVAWWEIDYSRTAEICVVDPVTGDGLAFRRDRQAQRELLKEFCKLSLEILAGYDCAAKDWRDRASELSSYAFWEKYLGL